VCAFDSGQVVIGGQELSRVRPYEIKNFGLSRTFQNVRLFEQMTVLDNILVVLTERNVWSSLFERHGVYHLDRAEAVLTRVGLWSKRDALASGLSYGQRKLLEIARVLAMDAKIILFDEPFAGLFKEMSKQVVEILLELKQAGKTIVLIEHNMELIRQLSDHLIVMDAGKLLAQGKPAEVLKRRDVIEAYLGE
jgi:ABC-type branched-subunit amino acid transport system ATPase component